MNKSSLLGEKIEVRGDSKTAKAANGDVRRFYVVDGKLFFLRLRVTGGPVADLIATGRMKDEILIPYPYLVPEGMDTVSTIFSLSSRMKLMKLCFAISCLNRATRISSREDWAPASVLTLL